MGVRGVIVQRFTLATGTTTDRIPWSEQMVFPWLATGSNIGINTLLTTCKDSIQSVQSALGGAITHSLYFSYDSSSDDPGCREQMVHGLAEVDWIMTGPDLYGAMDESVFGMSPY